MLLPTMTVASIVAIRLSTAVLFSMWIPVKVHSAYSYHDLVNENALEEDTYLQPEVFESLKTFRETDIKPILKAKLRQDGKNVSSSDLNEDPIMRANKFEGDIAGVNGSTIQGYIVNSNQLARNALRGQWRLWQNGEIPYVLSTKYGFYSKQVIAKAMETYQKLTCIRFKPRDNERDYLFIHPDDGCYSLVGRTGGRQPLSLDSGCIYVGTVIHELMHAIGFFHEQSRADRDHYIEIVFSNVESDAHDQFDKYSLRTIQHLDVEYDYSSIMHYGPFAFTRNGRRTIIAKKEGSARMGQRDGLSKIDLIKLKKLYQCTFSTGSSSSELTDQGASAGIAAGGMAIATTSTKPALPLPTTTTTTRSPLLNAASTSSIQTRTLRCEDQSWRCKFWKIFGRCHEQAYKLKCPKSCGVCDAAALPTTTTKIESTTSTVAPILRTALQTTTATFRRTTAPASSLRVTQPTTTTAFAGIRMRTLKPISSYGISDSAEVECKDDSPRCISWARNGNCLRAGYKKFMERTCRKSCGNCRNAVDEAESQAAASALAGINSNGNAVSGQVDFGNSISQEKQRPVKPASSLQGSTACQDKFSKCLTFANDGYCNSTGKSALIMAKYCPKSCGRC